LFCGILVYNFQYSVFEIFTVMVGYLTCIKRKQRVETEQSRLLRIRNSIFESEDSAELKFQFGIGQKSSIKYSFIRHGNSGKERNLKWTNGVDSRFAD
jgi:hypothetical protein